MLFCVEYVKADSSEMSRSMQFPLLSGRVEERENDLLPLVGQARPSLDQTGQNRVGNIL